MQMTKSKRHSKVIGDFGEILVCDRLSQSGFEVALVDQSGIDIIASKPDTELRLGITVKSRTRRPGTERESVTIFSRTERQKLVDACKTFACEPWVAIYAETADCADIYLTSLWHFENEYSRTNWSVREKKRDRYAADPEVKHFHFDFRPTNWAW